MNPKNILLLLFLIMIFSVSCPVSVSAAGISEETNAFLDQIQASEGWQYLDSLSLPQEKPTIAAVIDTGCDYTHPLLQQGLWINEAEASGTPGIDDDGNGYVDDVYGIDTINHDSDPMDDSTSSLFGHGTHVAGCVLLTAGVTETANPYGVQVMALKAGDAYGNFTEQSVLEAVSYATAHGASVINLSIRQKRYSETFYQALKEASNHAILVASSGNDGLPTKDFGKEDGADCYPAGFPFVIGVMSHTSGGSLCDFSNWDARAYSAVEYELCAPGASVMSCRIGGGYQKKSGTSMSSGIVSGAAALLCARQQDSSLSPRSLCALLSESCQSYITYQDSAGTLHSYPRLNLLQVLKGELSSRLILSDISIKKQEDDPSRCRVFFSLNNRGIPVTSASLSLKTSNISETPRTSDAYDSSMIFDAWHSEDLPMHLQTPMDSCDIISGSFSLKRLTDTELSQDPPQLTLTYQTAESAVPISADYILPDVLAELSPEQPALIPLRGITVSLSGLTVMQAGKTQQILITYLPENTTEDKTIIYTSSDPSIVSADSSGLLTAHKPGRCTLTISAKNGLTRHADLYVIAADSADNPSDSSADSSLPALDPPDSSADSSLPALNPPDSSAAVPSSPAASVKKTDLNDTKIRLSSVRFSYNGKKQRPSVSVKTKGNKTLKKNRDYRLSFENADSRHIGSYWVKVTGIGACRGSVRLSYRIELPKGKIYTVGNIRYKITSKTSHSKKSTGTATALAPTKKSVRLSSVPRKIKISKKTYRVTSIRKKAFAPSKKKPS